MKNLIAFVLVALTSLNSVAGIPMLSNATGQSTLPLGTCPAGFISAGKGICTKAPNTNEIIQLQKQQYLNGQVNIVNGYISQQNSLIAQYNALNPTLNQKNAAIQAKANQILSQISTLRSNVSTYWNNMSGYDPTGKTIQTLHAQMCANVKVGFYYLPKC
jgi:hypothetical protein